MAKDKKKGKMNDYNQIPVKQKEYYYDREETDKDIQKDFGDMLSGLKDMNKDLKKRAEKGEKPKLDIDISEGLMKKAQWINDMNQAKKEFGEYKMAGGEKNFENFLKSAIKAVRAGKDIKTG